MELSTVTTCWTFATVPKALRLSVIDFDSE